MFSGRSMSGVVLVLVMVFTVHLAFAQKTLPVEDFSGYRHEALNLNSLFGELNGSAVIINPGKQRILLHNEPLAKQRFSPFSTFKIIAAMLGLQHGVVKDANSKMHYNGTTYWHPAWNNDVTFKEAFQVSCIWYFYQIINALPPNVVESYLQQLPYGNADVSEWSGNGSNPHKELNGFWLNSSLRISPLEQAKAMHNLFYLQSPYPQKDREVVENFMQIEHSSVHGKTGSDGKGQSWFVGFIKKGFYKDYFAFYVQNASDSAPHAKNIALRFFEQHQY